MGLSGGQSFANFEQIVTGSGDDQLVGDDQDNSLDGGAGNDQLFGNEGDDTPHRRFLGTTRLTAVLGTIR